jgi:hypothetical protein
LNLGDTFVNKPAPGVPEHLWMVVSDPSKGSRVVLANVSSDDGGNPGLPTVQPGEHSFIKHASYLRCDKARVEDTASVAAAISKQLVVPQPSLSATVLTRVQQELLGSALVPNEAKNILRAQGITPGGSGPSALA